MKFETDYNNILKLLHNFQLKNYFRTRNFLDGDVSCLSPYITHGVLSVKQVAIFLLNKYGLKGPGNAEQFIFQLGWREYFQKIWFDLGDAIFEPIKNPQEYFISYQLSQGITEPNTGINVIDKSINQLYSTGYIHNHARMWIASITCNLNKTYFLTPAKWMYYHLLDGDIATNFLSWQWVAGTFSAKKYLCNQDNLNKYSKSIQKKSIIDFSYEHLADFVVDSNYCLDLGERVGLDQPIFIPELKEVDLDYNKSRLCLFSIWSLDPTWHCDEFGVEKVLLIEPSELRKLPMSEKRIEFILSLAKNIDNLKIVVQDFSEFKLEHFSKFDKVMAKNHPAIKHWSEVTLEAPDFLFEGINPPFRSYFDFWNKAKKMLTREHAKK